MRLTSEVQAVVDVLRNRGVDLISLPLDEARALYVKNMQASGGEPVALAEISDHTAPLADRDIPLRRYRPESVAAPDAPALIYFHGGGWVLGDLDSHDSVCRQLALRTGCVVIAVDYRMAPEHPMPVPSEDAIDAFFWLAEHAADFGIDATRMAVAGDSAGGHLSAVVALAARDRGFALRGQILIYPATDLRDTGNVYTSRQRNASFPPLTVELMNFFAGHAVAEHSPVDDWRVSPLCAEDLSGVAPALVITAGADILMDEGVLYAQWLAEAGVEMTHRHYRGVIHGFIGLLGYLKVTGECMDEIAGVLRRQLAIA